MTSEAASVAVSSERTLDDASVTTTLQTIEERTRAVSEVTDRLRPLIALAEQAPAFVAVLMDSFDEAKSTSSRCNTCAFRRSLASVTRATCRRRRPARPVVTGRGKLIMAEFNYAKEPVETFPVDQRVERFSMYALKAYMLPRLYWHGMLRGRA